MIYSVFRQRTQVFCGSIFSQRTSTAMARKVSELASAICAGRMLD